MFQVTDMKKNMFEINEKANYEKKNIQLQK
jgi:hypothetical protein